MQEEKNSRKLIQPDLLAMSQLLNFDEVRQPDCGRGKQIIFVTQEDEASDSEEEVPEVAAIEDKREERGSSLEGGTTLNLTLEEVRHIRTALTRAELEVSEKIRRKLGHSRNGWVLTRFFSQGLPPSVSQGRLCFSCMNSKFGLFWRGHPCNLCSMLICGKCVNKVAFEKKLNQMNACRKHFHFL